MKANRLYASLDVRFETDGADSFHVEPIPKAILVKTVMTGKDHFRIIYSSKTNLTLFAGSADLGFESFCKVYHQKCREHLGEDFFYEVFSSEEGVGGADEDEIEDCQVEHEFVEEKRAEAATANEVEDAECRDAPHEDKDHNEK
jgi:hypothetical protein